MSDQEHEDVAHEEMVAAEIALGGRHYRDAERHLAAAAHHGASREQVSRVGDAIHAAVREQVTRSRSSAWTGFLIGLFGYLLLADRQPAGWTMPLWTALALVVTPAVVGTVIGLWQGRDRTPGERFVVAMRAGGCAMALYAFVSMAIVIERLQAGSGSGDRVLAAFAASIVYGAIAGVVAGCASAIAGQLEARRGVR